jgi:hypothetical protein
MAHWAELNDDNIVLRVTVGDNDDPNGDEGYQWLIDNLGGRWIQTSYNANFRGRFAGIGDTYDKEKDAFLPPKSYPSWILDEELWQWKPPVTYPSTGSNYNWDEESESWVEVS